MRVDSDKRVYLGVKTTTVREVDSSGIDFIIKICVAAVNSTYACSASKRLSKRSRMAKDSMERLTIGIYCGQPGRFHVVPGHKLLEIHSSHFHRYLVLFFCIVDIHLSSFIVL